MSYAVIPFRLEEHRDALARLWSENLSDGRIASVVSSRIRWLYESGPDGPPTTMLCVVAESGEVVGCGSYLQRPTWVDGRRVAAGLLCDFAVARAHRVLGAALLIQRSLVEAARASGLELLYGYPNEKSLPVFKRIGYRVVGETSTWVKPLHAAYKVRGVVPWGWAVRAGAFPIDLGLAFVDLLRRARTRMPAHGRGLAAPDHHADAIWARVGTGEGVVGERSGAYLDWRYAKFPTADHHYFGTSAEGDDRLTGFAVYTLEGGKAVVRDIVVDPGHTSVEAVLLGLAGELRRQGVDAVVLSYLGPPGFGDRLRAAGFLRRSGARALVVHPDVVPQALRARVLEPTSWFMLDGELDI